MAWTALTSRLERTWTSGSFWARTQSSPGRETSQGRPVLGPRARRGERRLQRLLHPDRGHGRAGAAGGAAGEQELARQPDDPLHAGPRVVEALPDFLVRVAHQLLGQEGQVGGDGRGRVVHLVGDAGGELAQRRQPLGPAQRGPALLQQARPLHHRGLQAVAQPLVAGGALGDPADCHHREHGDGDEPCEVEEVRAGQRQACDDDAVVHRHEQEGAGTGQVRPRVGGAGPAPADHPHHPQIP